MEKAPPHLVGHDGSNLIRNKEQGRLRRALQESKPHKEAPTNHGTKTKDNASNPDKPPCRKDKTHYAEQNWHTTIRKWNKLMHALHGNGTPQEENHAKQEALTEQIMTAVKGHPGYNGKPLGNLVKWIKQLVATKQFRDQCATTAYQKPNALAQYAIQQAQWVSKQAGNAWSLKKAAEKGKSKGKGSVNQTFGTKGGKGQGKGKSQEKGTPWAQLLFQPIEFEMSREWSHKRPWTT